MSDAPEFTYEVEKLDAHTLLLHPRGDCLLPGDMLRMLRTAEMFLKSMSGRVCVIYDLSRLGRTGDNVRPILLEWEQRLQERLLRSAAYSEKPMTRLLASTMLQANQRKQAAVFATLDQALGFCRADTTASPG